MYGTSQQNPSYQPALPALCFQLPELDAPPEWLLLLPAGEVVGRDGRRWVNGRPDDVVAAFSANGADLPIDLEHATELKAPKGEPAPAAGWITQVENRNGEIWGKAEWTNHGKSLLSEKAYRYYSPVFRYTQGSVKRILALVNAGLTNRPNLRVHALNNTQYTQQEDIVMPNPINQALGLADDATEDQAVTAIKQMQTDHATALNRAQSAAPPLDKFVPRADYDTALNRAQAAENTLAGRDKAELESEIIAVVDQALEDKKIAPPSRDHYIAMCRNEGGLDLFKDILKTSPPMAADIGIKGKPAGTGTALNADERHVASLLGMSDDDYQKALDA